MKNKFKPKDFGDLVWGVFLAIALLAWISYLFVPYKAHAAWETTGNTVSTGQFIGSTNQQDFTIRTNNFDRLILKSQVNGTATNMIFPTNLASFKLSAFPVFLQSNGTLTGLYGSGSFLNLTSDGASFDGGTNVNIKQGASLRFYDGTNYSAFKASPNATNTTWTLPDTDGTGALTSDGNGNLSWQTSSTSSYPAYRTATTQTDNVTATDYTVECAPNGWEYLPTSVGVTGKHYEFINPHNAMCTVFANGSELIGNLNPEPKYKIQAGGAVTIVSNNVGWRVLK
jgi:hypothetical protein